MPKVTPMLLGSAKRQAHSMGIAFPVTLYIHVMSDPDLR